MNSRKLGKMRRVCLGLVLLAAGCQKTDTETLSRIGRKVADRSSAAFSDLRGRIDLKWKPPEPSLEDQVRLRLRYDRDLADCVHVGGRHRSPQGYRGLVQNTGGVLKQGSRSVASLLRRSSLRRAWTPTTPAQG